MKWMMFGVTLLLAAPSGGCSGGDATRIEDPFVPTDSAQQGADEDASAEARDAAAAAEDASVAPTVASDGGASAHDAATTTDAKGPTDATADAADAAPPAFDAGPACTRDTKYDTNCVMLNEPPAAYICYDPGGGHIPSACVINKGALVVCCPM